MKKTHLPFAVVIVAGMLAVPNAPAADEKPPQPETVTLWHEATYRTFDGGRKVPAGQVGEAVTWIKEHEQPTPPDPEHH